VSSRIIQVGLLATYLRELVESDELLQDVWIEGEVSSYTLAASGHAYFAIKDELAAIDCVMWKQTRVRQSFQPRVGDKIVVHGGATVYERNTRFQVKADVVYPAGAGILQLQLEQLKQRLEAEGLFDPSRKRALPLFPTRIGVVTSSTGAVWHDIQRVLGRRYPLAELILSPAVVQGERAPDAVVTALRRLDGQDVDVIIVARGGGSAEDLWAFNDERIARAIFASPVPVVSAIGHETDTSLADLVADVRAATPSVAAELVAPDLAMIALYVDEARERANQLAQDVVDARQRELATLQHRLALASPAANLAAMRATVLHEQRRLRASVARALERRSLALNGLAAVLHALDPASLFLRGYTHVASERTGEPVRAAAMLAVGDAIRAVFEDGSVSARVTGISAETTLP
jgi:exodeoxyribonuclease VII large subunit